MIEAPCFEQITTAQVAAFISGRVASRGLAPKTANRYRERAPEIRFLTLPQVNEQLLIFTEDLQMQAMVATLIYAGLRREELLWLTHDDIDWKAGKFGLIRVRAKTIDGESWEPKTKKNRAVPVSSSLRLYLDKWRLKAGQDIWFFPSPEGKRWDADNFSSDLRDQNEKAKMPWGSLDFRHTFGSQLAMKGESLYKISTLMGNSPEICRRHYAALIPEALTDSVEFSEEVISPTGTVHQATA